MALSGRPENIVFPADSGVVNVKHPPYSAKGDGQTDDTQAIQQALDDHPSANKIIYLPSGTYLISDTLKWPKGPHGGVFMKRTILQGESEAGTVLRLKDRCPGFQEPRQAKALIYTGSAPAQRFRNSIRNLTVDIGAGNPGATGVQYIANNQGSIHQVTIRNGGPAEPESIGLDLGYTNEQGPCLIRNVTIEGFAIGIRNRHVVDSVTMEFITLKNQSDTGISNDGQVLNIRGLKSENGVPAISNSGSPSVLTLVDADLRAPEQTPAAAIVNQKDAMLFARSIRSSGYAQTIAGGSGESVASPHIEEYSSHPPHTLFPATSVRSLALPVQDTPELPWGNIKHDWVSPLQFGGKPDGKFDNTQALQAALKSGKHTLYLPNGNWKFDGRVEVPAHVQRIIGCEAKVSGSGTWVFASGTEPLRFERLDLIYSNINLDHRSDRTLVLSSVTLGHGSYLAGAGSGDLFLEDVCGGPWRFEGQRVWARQLNPETEVTKIVNRGGSLWILGLKTEKGGTLVENVDGALTEILGCFAYANSGDVKPPMFINQNSSLSFSVGEMVIRGEPFKSVVRETQGGETKVLSMDDVPDRGGGSRVSLFLGRPSGKRGN